MVWLGRVWMASAISLIPRSEAPWCYRSTPTAVSHERTGWLPKNRVHNPEPRHAGLVRFDPRGMEGMIPVISSEAGVQGLSLFWSAAVNWTVESLFKTRATTLPRSMVYIKQHKLHLLFLHDNDGSALACRDTRLGALFIGASQQGRSGSHQAFNMGNSKTWTSCVKWNTSRAH